MKFLFLFASLLTSLYLCQSLAFDQSYDPAVPDKRALMVQGQVLSLRIIPADKTAKIFVMGKKVLEAKPKLLQVTAFDKNNHEELHLTQQEDHYTVTNPQHLEKPYKLKIRAQYNKSEEKFEVEVPSKMP